MTYLLTLTGKAHACFHNRHLNALVICLKSSRASPFVEPSLRRSAGGCFPQTCVTGIACSPPTNDVLGFDGNMSTNNLRDTEIR